jgi:hypothetical protein
MVTMAITIMGIITMGIIITAMEEVREDMDWHEEWDYWVMAWATMAAGRLSIRLRMATETDIAILLSDTRPITDMRSLMGMPLLLWLPPHHPFTFSSRKSCRSSHKLKLPTIGTTAEIRKGIIPT